MTEVYPVSPEGPSPEALDAAVRALTLGRGVFLRLHEGYGAVYRPSAGAKAPFPPSYRLRSADDLEDFVVPSPRARRIAAAFWPGPLELELGPADRPVRLAHAGPQALATLAAALPFRPAAAFSGAGAAASAAAWTAAPIAVDVVWDEGETSPQRATRVGVRDDGALSLLQAGAVAPEELGRRAPREILCVCTGNTCRSPMASALLAQAVADALGVGREALPSFGYRVLSAGVSAYPGEPASGGAFAAMATYGLGLGAHRARRADAELLAEADVIYAMTGAHLSRVRALLPPPRAKLAVLFDPAGRDVDDPFGGDDKIYRRTAERLAEIARQRAAEIVAPS
jgi:protein-tyrosine-phosphatase